MIPTTLDRANAARLEKALNKQWNFSAGIMTMREYLQLRNPIGKHVSYQEYASKKRNGEYKKLTKPKAIYQADFGDNTSVEVGKLIFDWLDVPDITKGEK